MSHSAKPVSLLGDKPVLLYKVGGGTDVGSLGGAIATAVRQHERIELRAVGAAAVNQSIKGMAIASNMLSDDKVAVTIQPLFLTEKIGGQEKTVIRMPVIVIPVDSEVEK